MDERKRLFVKALAKFLTDNQAHKSILLEMGKPEAIAWRDLRQTTPLFGWPTAEEAEKALSEWLGIPLEATPEKQTDPTKCAFPGKKPCPNKRLKGLSMCRKHQPYPARA
jgi:hypothetical protein